MTGDRSKTVRIIQIAELLVVTHQRASKIADTPGFPAPVGREGQSRQWDRRGTCGAAPGLRYGGPELGRLLRVPDL